MRNRELGAIGVLVAVGLYFCGIYVGFDSGRREEQQRAVKAEVGCWVIDCRSGKARFDYGVFPKGRTVNGVRIERKFPQRVVPNLPRQGEDDEFGECFFDVGPIPHRVEVVEWWRMPENQWGHR